MRLNKFNRLILTFVLFLFTITTTGIYVWAPVLAKNLDHHHEVSISADTQISSQWSLVHQDEQIASPDDTKNHDWQSYDEPPFHHSVKPSQLNDQLIVDPVFILSWAFPLILLFFSLFEIPIRSFDLRKSITVLSNSYTYTKELIVLRN